MPPCQSEARWLKAFERNNTITFSEAFPRAHKKLTKRANAQHVKRVEAALPKFARRPSCV
jgi:hypothetical protein